MSGGSLGAVQAGLPDEATLTRLAGEFFALLPGQTAEVALDGASPRWRFQVVREGQLLARGEVAIAMAVDAG